MIETLNGTKETVHYQGNTTIKLYDNVVHEDYPVHWHTSLEIIMPLDNTYTVSCNNTTYVLQEGDLLFINSGVLHQLTSPDKGRRYILLVDISPLSSMRELTSLSSILSSVVHITPDNSPKIYQQLQHLMYKIVIEYENEALFRDIFIYSKLLSIFAMIGRNQIIENMLPQVTSSKQQEYSNIILPVCDYINNHFTEDLTLEQAAKLAGFSKYHFSRIFKQYNDISFYQYLNRKRIVHATTLLMEPHVSVAEVSKHCGFSTISSFIRMFKIQKGCTPSEFKEMRRNFPIL